LKQNFWFWFFLYSLLEYFQVWWHQFLWCCRLLCKISSFSHSKHRQPGIKVAVTGYILHILQALYEKCIYWTFWHISNIVDLNLFYVPGSNLSLGHWLSWLTVFVVRLISSRLILGHCMDYAMAASFRILLISFVAILQYWEHCWITIKTGCSIDLVMSHILLNYVWSLPFIRFGFKLKCEYYKRLLERAFVSVAQKAGKSHVGLAAITCIKCANFHSPWFFILLTSCFCLIKSESTVSEKIIYTF
jgi:hypothetical protein